MGTNYEFTLYLEVTDEDALFQAAYARAIDDGCTDEDATDMLKPDNEIDPSACLRMLLDPGVSPAGTSIIDSACEG